MAEPDAADLDRIGHGPTEANRHMRKESNTVHHAPMKHGEYFLGDIQVDEEIMRKHTVTFNHTVTLQAGTQINAPNYSPFTGNAAPCLAQFPARNQGSVSSHGFEPTAPAPLC